MNVSLCNLTIRLLLGSAVMLPAMASALDFEVAPFVGYRFGGNFEDSATGQSADAKESAAYGLRCRVRTRPNGRGVLQPPID